jgi:very-short-patch-repair endonuclease
VDTERLVQAAVRRTGTITYRELRAHGSRRAIEQAVAEGALVRVARGRYTLPATPSALSRAHALNGVVSHESAAQLWFLETLHPPGIQHVTVRAGSDVRGPRGTRLHWTDLEEHERSGLVTTPLRTVIDCARTLPFADGLAVADSALRRREVSRSDLVAAARAVRGRGSVAARRVAGLADGRAANPFESALRATVLDLGLHGFTPQAPFRTPRLRGFVDLGDQERKVALEADSFAFHGARDALDRDCRRYDELVRSGWVVLRFSWEQVMYDAGWVASTVEETVRVHTTRIGRRRRR